MIRGITALRQAASAKATAPEGMVASAVELLEKAVAGAPDSSEAHRILATAHAITGNIERSVEHLRDALRLNPRDERAWLALARTLEDAGRSAEAEDVLRKAVIEERRPGVPGDRRRARGAALAIVDAAGKTPARR